jgi:tRNA-guanine family transglycosylase
MPVGTKGTIKGLTPFEMHQLDCKILLGNTYHLASHPSGEFLQNFGGLHKFMNWDGNILTDSGGFQMVSLAKLCEVSENGVEFENPDDGKRMFMRPEDSIGIQQQIGADIMMALDDVVKTTTEGERMGEACDRTLRW